MNLVIEDLTDNVLERLGQRAEASGRTVSDEAKLLLEEALGSDAHTRLDDVQAFVAKYAKDTSGILASDELVAERRRESRLEDRP